MDKGPLIGQGRTADIFAWGDTQVLKLFKDWCSKGMVQYELNIAHVVQSAGVPAPRAADDLVEIDGRWGILYKRVNGPSMLTCLIQQPWKVVAFGRKLAELQFAIHACAAPELPDWNQRLIRDIKAAPELTDEVREAVLKTLARLPAGKALCHGDFHPDNVILAPGGPVVIDWVNAVRGNPLADVARSSLMFRMGEVLPGTPRRRLIMLMRGILHDAYMGRYLQLSGQKRQAVDDWELPIAVARMQDGIASEMNGLHELIGRHMRDAMTSGA
jgi:aminoglycoside phosphotransferase (APT) family kinase protein